MTTTYQRLHEDYLTGLGEQTRQVKLDQFESIQDHMYNWLRKVRGLSPDQAQSVIDHYPELESKREWLK
jgi:hypothetical protein